MKRALAAALALVLLLFGCGKETEDISSPAPLPRNISLRPLEESRDFGSFTAAPAASQAAPAPVTDALSRYPGSLLAQLGDVEILLVRDLTGADSFAHGSYAGFTLRQNDGWLMVLDADRCDAGTVHHELAHILDGILSRSGALTEGEWMGFCPTGFAYGQTDWETYPDFFPDAYAMTSMAEDRARVFEDAMQLGPGVYENAPALWLKLECFSRALRTHFDCSDWPEKTPWELALD